MNVPACSGKSKGGHGRSSNVATNGFFVAMTKQMCVASREAGEKRDHKKKREKRETAVQDREGKKTGGEGLVPPL